MLCVVFAMKTSKKDSKKLFVVSVALKSGKTRRIRIVASSEYERNEKALKIDDALYIVESKTLS